MSSRLLTPDRLKFRCDGKKLYYTEEIDVPGEHDVQEAIGNTRKLIKLMLKGQPHRLRLSIKNGRTVVVSFSFAYKKKTHALSMLTSEFLGIILNEDPKLASSLIGSVSMLVGAFNDSIEAQRTMYEKLHGVKPLEAQLLSAEELEKLVAQGTITEADVANELDFSKLAETDYYDGLSRLGS